MNKVLMLVNHDVVIYNFRRELIERFLEEEYEVYISSPWGERIRLLQQMGCKYIETKISRHGMNPIEDMRLLLHYIHTIRTVRPNIILTYTIKPNIYGGLAAMLCGKPYISNITGLGGAVEKGGLLQKMTLALHRFALANVKCLFFQNTENLMFFEEHKIAEGKHRLIPGSGVNLIQHSFEEYPPESEPMRFLFVGRIMKEKGIDEFLEAAKKVKCVHPEVYFDVIGFIDDAYDEQLKDAEETGIITFLGHQYDVHAFIKRSHAIILPSYHEGMANVLLESAATGRPVIATLVPGCRETFEDGITGFGVKPRDSEDLVQKILTFISLPYKQKVQMGRRGREKMENEYDRTLVVNAYLQEIEKVMRGSKNVPI